MITFVYDYNMLHGKINNNVLQFSHVFHHKTSHWQLNNSSMDSYLEMLIFYPVDDNRQTLCEVRVVLVGRFYNLTALKQVKQRVSIVSTTLESRIRSILSRGLHRIETAVNKRLVYTRIIIRDKHLHGDKMRCRIAMLKFIPGYFTPPDWALMLC